MNLLLAVGPQGLDITVPPGVELLPVEHAVESGSALSLAEQQQIVQSALDAPGARHPSLKEAVRGKRRAVIVAGDLALPAPYDVALPPLVRTLVEAEIRPTRISVLAYPGLSGPVLGRAAVHRYGEEIVGEHELRAWAAPEGQLDSVYAAADLRILVAPRISAPLGIDWPAETPHFVLELQLGKKARIAIAGAACVASQGCPSAVIPQPGTRNSEPDVHLTTGGGADWETTLEEALLGLHCAALDPHARTCVLAFDGGAGLGSAHFTRDLWALLAQAEELLAGGGALAGAISASAAFEPAAALAFALSVFERVVLFSRGLAEHSEGEELSGRLLELPAIGARLQLCASEAELWLRLQDWHGARYRLHVNPLGWRAWA